MNVVKRMFRKGAKIVFGVVVGIGLIGFVKGLIIGYYIGRHKSTPVGNIKCN